MGVLDWVAIVILVLFWFFAIAPLIFHEKGDGYKDSVLRSLVLQGFFVSLFGILGLLFWAAERVWRLFL